jgi:phosphatidylserine/phosphatidylglycerophosphate/cardiolipin synthase-like enzyme
LLVLIFVFYSYQRLSHTQFPSPENPLIIYANQTGDDLKRIFLSALSQTKKSLFLQIYGCTDPNIITSIQNLQKNKISCSVFYDPSGSLELTSKISGATPLYRRGLMHKKILILDNEKVFIGSANFTPTSLCMHDNTVIGFHSQELAYDILYNISQNTSYQIGNQTIELWHLPDQKHACLNKILYSIESAKKTIRIALFTFTHPKILEELFKAKKRGVHVEVALDYSSSLGASSKTVEFLEKRNISLYIGTKTKLLHHKWCLIDNTTLLLGSANWTKSAFAINEDCLLVIYKLNDLQKRQFQKIWSKIESSSYKKILQN